MQGSSTIRSLFLFSKEANSFDTTKQTVDISTYRHYERFCNRRDRETFCFLLQSLREGKLVLKMLRVY